jgi:predicted MFS family arabinose efflux permease
MLVGASLLAGVVLVTLLQPVNEHLALQGNHNPIRHLLATVVKPRYLQGFATTTLLSTGGFMLMPFGSAFSVHNMGVRLEDLPMVYVASGVFAMVTGPLVGKLSDRFGKLPTFCAGSALMVTVTLVYTRLGLTPLAWVVGINVLIFTGVSARMISASALMSGLPAPADRGAFMSVSSSLQQISGGFAAAIAGYLVSEAPDGSLVHFERIGDVVAVTTVFTVIMMFFIDRLVRGASSSAPR